MLVAASLGMASNWKHSKYCQAVVHTGLESQLSERPRQEDEEFKTSLDYNVVRPCVKKKKKRKKKEKTNNIKNPNVYQQVNKNRMVIHLYNGI
jgi:hypothetical protein